MICSVTAQGMRYAVLCESKKAAYCALHINCGTRMENILKMSSRTGTYPGGTAHFVEHALFKGTEKRKAEEINGCLERLGGDLNAYTTKEEIVLHATVLKEDLPVAADLLLELAVSSIFPEDEILKERNVILDEIAGYKDFPADDIYDRFESMIFEGHPLSGAVLGSAASVRRIGPEHLKAYVKEYFIPSRMVFSVVSPLPEAEVASMIESLSEAYFPSSGISDSADATESRSVPSAAIPATSIPSVAIPATAVLSNVFNLRLNRHNHQANCITGSFAPSLYDEKERMATILMANILGGPASNSILNSILREQKGWVYNVECNYVQYADTGLAAICFGCDKERVDDCLEVIDSELEKLRSAAIVPETLEAAKKQLKGQLAIASDNGESQALSMAKSMAVYGRINDDETVSRLIDEVTSAHLQSLALQIFNPANLSLLVYL